ncbi:MAG: ROK family protein [Culicoidibacterales bacterium]
MVKVDNSVSRKINKRLILEAIISSPGISRAELSRATQLNKATVSYIVEELYQAGIIKFRVEKITTGARKATAIELNETLISQIIIEIKRKKIRLILTNMLGQASQKCEVRIKNITYNSVVQQIKAAISTVVEANQSNNIAAIGISIPATVRLDKTINFASHFNWKDVDLRGEIEQTFGIKTYLENEANLGAIAEKNLYFQEVESLININVESGVGIGVIQNGKLELGYTGYYGEFGHTTLVPHGKQCSCGNQGCFELYTSELHIMNNYRSQMQNPELKTRDFIAAINNNELTALKSYHEFIDYFTIGIHNLLVLINPEVIIINSRIICAIPTSIDDIKKQLISKEVHYQDIKCSKNIDTSSLIGMSQYITQEFLDIDQLRIAQFAGIEMTTIKRC